MRAGYQCCGGPFDGAVIEASRLDAKGYYATRKHLYKLTNGRLLYVGAITQSGSVGT